MNKLLGKWWSDRDCDIYEIEGRRIVLNARRWTGEEWHDCWETDEKMLNVIEDGITVKPIYEEISEEQYEIVRYEIIN